MLVFPGYQALDVFGALDPLNLLSMAKHMDLSIIAATMEPVPSGKIPWMVHKSNSSFSESIVPTHTFDNAPPLDVLIVPGGIGTRAPAGQLDPAFAFIKERYPSLQYLLTVCTGAGIAARAGVLDGRNATTNKRAWAETTALGPNVNWIGHARWVVDGNIWTSSGVSAGIDLMIAFIEHIWGEAQATSTAKGMEYVGTRDPNDDPFAAMYNVTDVPPRHTNSTGCSTS